MAGEHLADLGHQRIGFLRAIPEEVVHMRLDGLRDALGRRNLAVHPDWIAEVWEDAAPAIARIMNLPSPPTAFFCANDSVAAACMRALRKMGLNVPGDVSVVGFDDEKFCEMLHPRLSTVRHPAFEIGVRAVELLLRQMQGPVVEDERVQRLPVSWVERESTARVK